MGFFVNLSNAKVKKLIIAATAIFIAIISLVGYYFTNTCYAVKVDDKIVGIVKDKQDIERVIEDIKNSTKEKYNKEVKIRQQITYDRMFAGNDKIVQIDEIESAIKENITLYTEGYSIKADGKRIVTLVDQKSAEELLDMLKEKYVQKDDKEMIKEVGFVGNIDIQAEEVIIEKIMTLEEAFNYIVNGTEKIEKYTVQKGDTASHIAVRYDISLKDIENANPDIDLNRLQIGQEINLTVPKPLIDVKIVKGLNYEEGIPYDVVYESTDNLYKGSTKVKVSGKKGKKKVEAELIEINGILREKKIISEDIIEKPRTKVVLRGTKPRPKTLAYGSFINPGGSVITSRFGARWGRQHNGIDIGMPIGTSVKAADGGKVTFAGWKSGYGYLVIIDHENGYKTYYGHLSKTLVKKGQRVYRGQIIAKSGNTGRTTGPHLHFEVRKNNVPVNPLKYVKY